MLHTVLLFSTTDIMPRHDSVPKPLQIEKLDPLILTVLSSILYTCIINWTTKLSKLVLKVKVNVKIWSTIFTQRYNSKVQIQLLILTQSQFPSIKKKIMPWCDNVAYTLRDMTNNRNLLSFTPCVRNTLLHTHTHTSKSCQGSYKLYTICCTWQ